MRANDIMIGSSFVLLIVSFWNRNDLPRRIDYVPEIHSEPMQTSTRKSSFTSHFAGIDYLVEPKYEYELYGMIVSYRHHDGDSLMHRLANDHLNMLDVCVIWGDNTRNARLDKIRFWNGIFTCNFQTRDQAAWDAFDIFEVSNNHLISDDPFIRNKVRGIRIGDQIRVRGVLARYGRPEHGMRETSTTRLDTGNGACETIFVEQFEIVRPARSDWRIAMYTALVLCLLGLAVHFKRPYRPFERH